MGQKNPEEQDSAPDAGMDPGDSITRSGEDIRGKTGKEAGRHEMGTKGATDRPMGGSTARDSTGIDPQDPIDPDSPNLRAGGG